MEIREGLTFDDVLLEPGASEFMPAMVDVCLAALLSLKDQGLAIVLVEQNTQRALDVADSVTVVASGRVVFQGSGAQARADPDLVDSLLGLSGHGPPAA